ncbi:hypothetical protein [Sulfitobacter guttiformis]|uniref:hypothetical protein n=1 Tax=Sulfitobacter guttiformis TaxID=74349 RepID=UPI0012EC8112|nr:hypothetical protein [Sulfitobacter guttiformis]
MKKIFATELAQGCRSLRETLGLASGRSGHTRICFRSSNAAMHKATANPASISG